MTKSISDRAYQVQGTLSLQLGHRKGVKGRKEVRDQGWVILAAGMKSLFNMKSHEESYEESLHIEESLQYL